MSNFFIFLAFTIVVSSKNFNITEWNVINGDFTTTKWKSIYGQTSDEGLYMFGGYGYDNNEIKTLSYFNYKDQTMLNYFFDWNSFNLTKLICEGQCSTTIDNEIFFVIDYELWSLNTDNKIFKKIDNIPFNQVNGCLTNNIYSKDLYWIDGTINNIPTNKMLIYDTNSKEWTSENINKNRSLSSCAFYVTSNNTHKIAVFGGKIANNINDDTIELYDIQGKTSELLTSTLLSKKTFGLKSIIVGDYIYNIGGDINNLSSFIFNQFNVHTNINLDNNYLSKYIFMPCLGLDILYKSSLYIFSGHNGKKYIPSILYSNTLPSLYSDNENNEDDDSIFGLVIQFLDPKTWGLMTIIVILSVLLLIILSVFALIQKLCRCSCCGLCNIADDMEWWRLGRYSLQVYDIVTDANLCVTLWETYLNDRGMYSYNTVNINNKPSPELFYFYTSITATVFVGVPYICNLLFVFLPCGLPRILKRYPEASSWLRTKASIFGFLVIISGSTYASLTLANSKLFGLRAFTMGLCKKQLLRLQHIQLVLNILLENVPQLLLQLTVLWYIDFNADLTILMSLGSSGLSIMIGFIATCIVKSQKLDDMEITLEITSDDKITKKLRKKLGYRLKLAEKIEEIYGLQKNIIEVPTISKLDLGCVAMIVITKTPKLDNIRQFTDKKDGLIKAVKKAFDLKDEDIIYINAKPRTSNQNQLQPTNVNDQTDKAVIDDQSVSKNSSLHTTDYNDDKTRLIK